MPTPESYEKKDIKQLLHLKGYFVYYNLQGLASYKGIPDLTCISPKGQVVQIECKAKNKHGVMGKQSEHQKNFQQEWESQGGIYLCGDFKTVEEYLSAK